jgi:putative membrane protein
MRLYITLFFIIVLLAIAFIFGSQNEQLLMLNYLVARTEMTVAAATSLFTGIGFFFRFVSYYLLANYSKR